MAFIDDGTFPDGVVRAGTMTLSIDKEQNRGLFFMASMYMDRTSPIGMMMDYKTFMSSVAVMTELSDHMADVTGGKPANELTYPLRVEFDFVQSVALVSSVAGLIEYVGQHMKEHERRGEKNPACARISGRVVQALGRLYKTALAEFKSSFGVLLEQAVTEITGLPAAKITEVEQRTVGYLESVMSDMDYATMSDEDFASALGGNDTVH